MYRAVAKKVLHHRVPLEKREIIINLAADLKIDFKLKGPATRIIVDGEDLADSLDLPEIVSFASKIASIPELRPNLTQIHNRQA